MNAKSTPSTSPSNMRFCAIAASVALFGSGCEPDPIATDLDVWYYGLSAVLVENASLAHQIQDFAADVHKAREKGPVSAEKTAKTLKENILPLAQTVAEHAVDVRPQTAEFQAMHDGLTTVWTERAEAYDGILTAWDGADAAALEAGMAKVGDLRIAESIWFQRTNAALAPKGYRFEEFPRSVPNRPSN
ncbi:MAG: hypothetical protein CL927_03865 [Deltaproteobacteria bacterium]|nr:hypothetical protein [Deltaproteobacteria bacterium]HCH61393.1 hypothetical protein [Deltaproteobacteria bacterium]